MHDQAAWVAKECCQSPGSSKPPGGFPARQNRTIWWMLQESLAAGLKSESMK
jgi:hypothetical protein